MANKRLVFWCARLNSTRLSSQNTDILAAIPYQMCGVWVTFLKGQE